LLNEGAPPSDLGALEWEAENEIDRLDKLAGEILEKVALKVRFLKICKLYEVID
jgi:hypothetical protein